MSHDTNQTALYDEDRAEVLATIGVLAALRFGALAQSLLRLTIEVRSANDGIDLIEHVKRHDADDERDDEVIGEAEAGAQSAKRAEKKCGLGRPQIGRAT